MEELLLNKVNTKSNSLIGPIYDVHGNEIYPTKYRKPKWVAKIEQNRFFNAKDDSLDVENSRNNRIKMEDPFLRRPHDNSVFTHIEDLDICKFIVG